MGELPELRTRGLRPPPSHLMEIDMFEVLAQRIIPTVSGSATVVAVFYSRDEAAAHALALNSKAHNPFYYFVNQR